MCCIERDSLGPGDAAGSVVIQVKYSDDVGEFYEKAFT